MEKTKILDDPIKRSGNENTTLDLNIEILRFLIHGSLRSTLPL